MKNKVYQFVFSFFVLLLWSCGEGSKDHQITIEEITFEDDNPVDVYFSELFDTCYYVPLSSDVIIGDISQLHLGEKGIYLLDSRISNSVYKFSWNGALVSYISSEGQGPGEYIFPQYFALSDGEDSLYLYSNGLSKVLLYSFENQFIAEFKLNPVFSVNGLKKQGDQFLMGVQQNETGSSLITGDLSFSNFENIPVPVVSNPLLENVGKFNYFYQKMNEDGYFYQPPHSPYFYDLINKTLIRVLRFEFQKRGIYQENSDLPLSEYLFRSRSEDKIYLGSNHVDAGNVMILDLIDSGLGAAGIYDKKRKKAYKVTRFINDMSLIMNLSGIPGAYNNQPGYLTLAMPYGQFESIRSKLDFQDNPYREVIEKISSDDPESLVLMIYKFKTDLEIDLD